jgi:hypothetical protein
VFTELCAERGLPCQLLGQADLLQAEIDVAGQFRAPLRDLRAAWSTRLPSRFEV